MKKYTNTIINTFIELPVLLLIVMLVGGLTTITIWEYYEQLSRQYEQVHKISMIEKSLINYTINSNMSYAKSLVSFLDNDSKFSKDKEAINYFLNTLLQNIIANKNIIIIYSKNFIVEYVYPTNAVITEGFDISKNSRLFEVTSDVIKTKKPNISSIDFNNNDIMNLMISIPIIEKNKKDKKEIKGIVEIIFPFDWDWIIKTARPEISFEDIDFALVKKCEDKKDDNEKNNNEKDDDNDKNDNDNDKKDDKKDNDGNNDDSYKIIYGNANLLKVPNPVKLSIDLPIQEKWELIAYPKSGWGYNISKINFFNILIKYLVWIMTSVTVYLGFKRNVRSYLKNKIILKLFEENTYVWSFDVRDLKNRYIEDSEIVGHFKNLQTNKSIADIIHYDSMKTIYQIIKQQIIEYENNKIIEIKKILEIQLKSRKGHIIWYEITLLGMKNRKDDIYEILGITTIIEERKRIEQQFWESEKKYRIMTENLRDSIWAIDAKKMEYTYATNNTVQIVGYEIEEIIGKKISKIYSSQDVIKIAQMLQKSIKDYRLGLTNKVHIFAEVQLIHKKGYLVWCEISANVLMTDDGEPLEILGTTRVIEERKEMERRLKESERKYRLIVNNTKDMISVTDVSMSKFLYVSEACYELFGYTQEEYLQLSMRETMSEDSYQLVIELLETQTTKYLKGEISNLTAVFELQQYHKDGFLIWVEISAKMIKDDDGNLSEMIVITRNIADRKEVEFQILEQKEELERLNATKDKFFSIIAHDLRNPFSALLNMAELLNDTYSQISAVKAKEIIKIIYNSSNQIYQLLENLLIWARSSVGRVSFDPTANELNSICSSVINGLELQSKVKNINISIVDTEFKKYVLCDINMIETVIRNLISNAIKFSNNDSVITIDINEYQENSNYYIIKISDTGVGIPLAKQTKIFDISEKTTTRGTNNEVGTGLGLILCKEFIDRHNCKIWVESEVGTGTTFCFTLQKAQ